MIKVDIVCGLLGVGKTTLIQHMLNTVYSNQKVIIVENEIGEINLDIELFDFSDIEVAELTSGCVCCTLKLNFMELLEKFSGNTDFDTMIIEPSGIADIRDILEVCNNNPNLEINRIIMVVNTKRIERFLRSATALFIDQIKHVKTIYFNHSDSVSKEMFQSAKNYLQEINPLLSTVEKPLHKLTPEDFPDTPDDSYFELMHTNIETNPLKKSSFIKLNTFPGTKGNIHSTCISFAKPFSEESVAKLMDFARDLSEDEIFRMKGYLLLTDGSIGKFDYAAGEIFYCNLQTFASEKINKLIIIGKRKALLTCIDTLTNQYFYPDTDDLLY